MNAHNLMIRRMICYGFSIVIMKGISLLMLPWIAHQLSQVQMGLLEVLVSFSMLGSILVGLGLEDALYRFAGGKKSTQEQNKIVSTIFILSLLIGLTFFLLSVVLISLLNPMDLLAYSSLSLVLVVSIIALEGVLAVPLGWLRMKDRAATFMWLAVGRAAGQAILTFALLQIEASAESVLIAGLVAALMQGGVLAYLLLRETSMLFYASMIPQLFRYSGPIVLSGVVLFVLSGLDRWMLANWISLEAVAVYGVAAKVALAVVLLMQPFGMWWSAKRFGYLETEEQRGVAAKVITMGVLLLSLIALWVAILGPMIIDWLFPVEYQGAKHLLVGIVLILYFKELTELLNIGCLAGQSTSQQFYINLVAALLGVSLMWLSVIGGSVWGVICSLIFAQGLRVLLFYRVGQRLSPLPFQPLHLIAVCTTTVILIGATRLAALEPYLLSMAVLLTTLAIVPLIKPKHGLNHKTLSELRMG